MDDAQAAAARVLDALGTAWTIHGLYPDPDSQPAFRRSLETIRQAVTEPLVLEIRADGFLLQGEPVEVRREGTDRLARRMFLHGVETLRVVGEPRDEEVGAFFELLARDEEELVQGGGVEAAMLRHGIDTFQVVERPPLVEATTEEVVERDDLVVRVLEAGSDPELFAKSLLAEAGEDPEVLADLFTGRYREVLGRVGADDVAGREEAVRVFVEAFFHLGEEFQVGVLGRFLESAEVAEHQVFLDQFAGYELARLAPRLDPRGFSLLLDYARVSTDQADKRPDELLGLLGSEDVEGARRAVVTSMQDRLGEMGGAVGIGDASERLCASLPDPSRSFYAALGVFRGLLEVEDRPGRFERLLRIWTGKIAGTIRRGEFRRAELWLRAALDQPTWSADRAEQVEAALEQLGAPDVLTMLIGELAEGKDGEAQGRLLQAIGPPAVDSLVELLGVEEDAARRRSLMEVLTLAARKDPGPVVDHLGDERWYVVRNLTIVLGRIGTPAVVPALLSMLRHPDHRVRVEALRALPPIAGAEAVRHLEAALEDPHERVRQTAIGLLGTTGGDAAEELLIAALHSPTLGPAEKRRVVGLLAERRSDRARAALDRLAGRRFVLSASKRMVRDAARQALVGSEGGPG